MNRSRIRWMASLSISFVLAGRTHAACMGLDTAAVACTGIDIGPVTSNYAGGNGTVRLSQWSVDAGRASFAASAPLGTIGVTGAGVSFTNAATVLGFPVLEVVGIGGASLSLDGGSIASPQSGGIAIGVTTVGPGSAPVTVVLRNVSLFAWPLATGDTSVPTGALYVRGGRPSVFLAGGSIHASTNGVGVTSSGTDLDFVTDAGQTIETTGAKASAIVVSGPERVHVENGGLVTTDGVASHGIDAFSLNGPIDIGNAGTIRTGQAAAGIYALSGTAAITIRQSGEIVSQGATADLPALWVRTGGNIAIDNAPSGKIHGGGGKGAAIALDGGAAQTILNAGTLDALSDVAIVADVLDRSSTGKTLHIVNSGDMTGSVAARTSAVTLENSGTWTLRGAVAEAGAQVRTRLAVGVSDLGTSGANTVDNTGTLALATHDGTATSLDATGQYLPFGDARHALALQGPAQGQLLGVQSFTQTGTLDLQRNPVAGDVLLISGGASAGTSGGGTFVSNGGTLKVDTVLDDGASHGISDVLVVDGTRVGAAGATRLAVRNAGGAGALTPGDGIAVVNVLDRAASASGAFVLDGRVVAGAYDYRLYQGGVTDGGDGNWYLRSALNPPAPVPPPAPDPPDPPTPKPPAPAPVIPIIRPEVGAYLANQAAARDMFRHSLHDRVGDEVLTERRFLPRPGTAHAGWARVAVGHADMSSGRAQLDTGTTTTLLQFGGDIHRWRQGRGQGQGRYHLGLMAGIGHASSHTDSSVTGYRADGEVDGYSVGVYGTWYEYVTDPGGTYVDAWIQYGHYSNTVSGQSLPREDYHSATWSGSLEIGYALPVSRGRQYLWYVEPQAQVTGVSYTGGGHVERNGTRIAADGASGVQTRLGVRAYARALNRSALRAQPFLTLNWWHATGDNAVAFNGQSQSASSSGDIGEVKIGAQAELGRNWSGWVQGVLRKGFGGDYRSYSGSLGVRYTW